MIFCFLSFRDDICMSHTFLHAYVNLGVLLFVWEKETKHLSDTETIFLYFPSSWSFLDLNMVPDIALKIKEIPVISCFALMLAFEQPLSLVRFAPMMSNFMYLCRQFIVCSKNSLFIHFSHLSDTSKRLFFQELRCSELGIL